MYQKERNCYRNVPLVLLRCVPCNEKQLFRNNSIALNRDTKMYSLLKYTEYMVLQLKFPRKNFGIFFSQKRL